MVTRVAKIPPSSKYDPGVVTLRKSTLFVSMFAVTVVAGWSAGATWLALSKDTLGSHMVSREAARQYVYEDRIAALKAEIDKLSSRQLVDQDSVEARVAELMTRQGQIENRQAIVTALTEAVSGQQVASGRTARPALQAQQPAAQAETTSSVSSFAPQSRPMPVPDMPGLRREQERRQGQPVAGGWEQSLLEPKPLLGDRLARVEQNMTRISTAQIRAMSRLESAVTAAHGTLRTVISDVGLDPDRIAAGGGRQSGQGGPFVPANVDPRMGPLEASIARIQPRIAQIERLRGAVNALPLRRPMSADVEQSSPFGHRLDPFTRGLAMHTGIDFRAEHGSPVRTAGAGRVITAEYSGGYGNMVEIDHGSGVTTRYAHLSHMSVSEGQSVQAGAIIGRVGSTGRSTGPHLHYETRIEGDAVDPQRFLRAGSRFLGAAHAP
jgi:murein DD-endopeptidase MepM/ murein hydrolase activator NlpD